MSDYHAEISELQRQVVALEKDNAVNAVQYKSIEKRLHSIEDTSKWLLRLVSGSVVLAITGFAIKGGFFIG